MNHQDLNNSIDYSIWDDVRCKNNFFSTHHSSSSNNLNNHTNVNDESNHTYRQDSTYLNQYTEQIFKPLNNNEKTQTQKKKNLFGNEEPNIVYEKITTQEDQNVVYDKISYQQDLDETQRVVGESSQVKYEGNHIQNDQKNNEEKKPTFPTSYMNQFDSTLNEKTKLCNRVSDYITLRTEIYNISLKQHEKYNLYCILCLEHGHVVENGCPSTYCNICCINGHLTKYCPTSTVNYTHSFNTDTYSIGKKQQENLKKKKKNTDFFSSKNNSNVVNLVFSHDLNYTKQKKTIIIEPKPIPYDSDHILDEYSQNIQHHFHFKKKKMVPNNQKKNPNNLRKNNNHINHINPKNIKKINKQKIKRCFVCKGNHLAQNCDSGLAKRCQNINCLKLVHYTQIMENKCKYCYNKIGINKKLQSRLLKEKINKQMNKANDNDDESSSSTVDSSDLLGNLRKIASTIGPII